MLYSKYLKLLTYFTVMFMPVVPAIMWLGAFVAIDFLTGLWKAKKLKEPIQSKKMANSITKVVMYFLAIICSRVMETQFLPVGLLPFTITQACIGFISVIEFKSIMENISTILEMPLWAFIKEKLNGMRDNKLITNNDEKKQDI